MSEQPYPPWNTILLSLEEAEDRLHTSTFVLRLGQQKDPRSQQSYYEWGTGFFCTPELALTADHNLRPYGEEKYSQAYYKGVWLTLEWIKGWSAERADIAVMRCVKNPDKVSIDPLPVAYLDPAFPPRVRRHFWGGRAICIYGYPFRGIGQESWRIDDVGLMPVDIPEDVITTLLDAFIQETRSAVETHISQGFKEALSTLLAHEKALQAAQAAGRSREAR